MKSLIIYGLTAAFFLFVLTGCSPKVNSSAMLFKEYSPDAETLSQYPEAAEGMKRCVIGINEVKASQVSLEFYVGKETEIDCNKHWLQGQFDKQFDKASGIYFFEFNGNGDIMSTRMGCPESSKKMAFISGKPVRVDLKPNNLFVIYLPEDLELRYNLWENSTGYKTAKQI